MRFLICSMLLLAPSLCLAGNIQPYQANGIGVYQAKEIEPYQPKQIEPNKAKTIEPYNAKTVEPYKANAIEPAKAEAIKPLDSKPVKRWRTVKEIEAAMGREIKPVGNAGQTRLLTKDDLDRMHENDVKAGRTRESMTNGNGPAPAVREAARPQAREAVKPQAHEAVKPQPREAAKPQAREVAKQGTQSGIPPYLATTYRCYRLGFNGQTMITNVVFTLNSDGSYIDPNKERGHYRVDTSGSSITFLDGNLKPARGSYERMNDGGPRVYLAYDESGWAGLNCAEER